MKNSWKFVACLALCYTLLAAAKPLHIDDTFIYRVAQQIHEHPLDPYGFDIFWFQWPQPVHEELTPPVLPYWWSLGLGLFGERPVLWKLWMLPFALLFCGSLFLLFRRFARGLELPLTTMTVLSPAFLPSFNLMQDVPAQALGLSSLALYLRAAALGSWPGALAAGVVAGLAAQTKYTTVTVLGAMLVHGVLFGRLRLAVLAVLAAAGLFAGWEAFMTARYGQGMFLGQVGSDLFWAPRWAMVSPLLRQLGGTLAAPLLLGAAALGLGRRWVLLAGGLLVAGYVGLLFGPVEGWLYPFAGLLWVAVLVSIASRLLYRRGVRGGWLRRLRRNRTDLFLLFWFGGELIGYFATSPFPALRRVMGVWLVSAFLIGRLAALARRRPGRALPVSALVAAGVLLGLAFQFVDWKEARAQQRAVSEVHRMIGPGSDADSIWFTGHWGFKFYAERAGWRALIPDHSHVDAGDWIVVPEPVDQQAVALPESDFALVDTWSLTDFPPLKMNFGFYGGRNPLEHLAGSRLRVRLYQARRPGVPRSSWHLLQVVQFVRMAASRQAVWAVPALCHGFEYADPRYRHLAATTLGQMGPRAAGAVECLRAAANDPEPFVRAAVNEALARIADTSPSR